MISGSPPRRAPPGKRARNPSYLTMPPPQVRAPGGLYDSGYEHDACGVAFVAHLDAPASHEVISRALWALEHLEHRGAEGADADTGDGAGILLQTPDRFLREEVPFELPDAGRYGVAVCFLPSDEWARDHAADLIERNVEVIRRAVEKQDLPALAIASLSTRTLVYKGMLTAPQLSEYFPDLKDERLVSRLALVHSRFSTNTFPSWELAHPYRYLAHNGEINTLRGNRNWHRARELTLASPLFGDDVAKIRGLLRDDISDSASLDGLMELLVLGGRSPAHAMSMLIPEAYQGRPELKQEVRDFYAYHSSLIEPWDGPAAVAFTDGRVIGATLDRNGLRPGRWVVTRDGWVVLASETGVLEASDDQIVAKGRLRPGKLFLVDLERDRIVPDEDVKAEL